MEPGKVRFVREVDRSDPDYPVKYQRASSFIKSLARDSEGVYLF